MTTDGDTLYNVKFAEAVRDAQPKDNKNKKLPPPPKIPKKPKRKGGGDEEEDDVKSEPGLSGDE
jgi:hypothetical protein